MRWIVLFAVGLSGCLYISGRNHAPSADIDLPSATQVVGRCASAIVKLQAVPSDPDGDEVSYRWTVRVTSVEPSKPGQLYLARATTPDCFNAKLEDALRPDPQVVGTAPELELAALPARGTYLAVLEVQDERGARAVAEKAFTVTNSLPAIEELRLERDPDVNTYRLPDPLTNKYPAHAHYLAWITKITDGEDPLGCDAKPLLTWEPLERTAEDFEYWEPLACDKKKHPFGALRLRLRGDRALADGKLGVKVTIKDPLEGSATAQQTQAVVANRPPCITATEPYWSGPVKVIANADNSFRATFVSDDVPQAMEFTWSVKDPGAESFSTVAVQLSDSLSTLTLPPLFRTPGQKVQLRVSVREVGGAEPGCPATEKSCLLQQGCHRWVTWEVDFL